MKTVAKTISRAVMVFLVVSLVFLRKTKKPKTPPKMIAIMIMIDRYRSGSTDRYSRMLQTISAAMM